LTPLKLFQRSWQSEKFHRDINYRIFWPNFSGFNDTAETISAKPLTEKSWGLPTPHFRFQRCPLKLILATFEEIISANTMTYAKRF
jgi:hypothetical protein